MNQEIITLAEEAGSLLKKKQQTISVAESSTGGLVSAHLLGIGGASAYFLGGSVIYTRFAGRGFLGVTDEDMEGLRAATEPYARLNAERVKTLLGSTWGVAGPTGNRYGDAAGHTCIAVSGPVYKSITIETGQTDRKDNMVSFTHSTLDLLITCLKE